MAQAPVDIPVKISGLSDLQKLERRMQALEKEVTRLQVKVPKAANGISKFGLAARGSAGAVRTLGTAIKTTLGPISAALAAISGVGAAFNTLKNQDFAEAKFESLGGNADQLVTNLQAVSNELQGQASVAELTGAAYDVASAGFSSAAEASQVLKAASQGATGGFAELNTVANATTSVLNAYQQSAAQASTVVDQFIQTQNDGKIVVAEYAANIGKVASAAAGLGVPLSEVNAVIAQSTASGVQAEVAFTGLKGALARLASGEAAKALKGTGIEISAATVEADGLLGTLEKLEGLDTGQLFKALGTEAGPALLPVIQNLERYEELIRNQEQAQGVAAAAASTAAGTIQGAWTRVTTAFQNLFSDQSELGQVIRATLLMAAATVEALAAAFKLVVAPIRAVIEAISAIAGAFTGVKDGEAVLASLTAMWFNAMAAVNDFSNTVIAVGRVIGDYVAPLIETAKGWFSGLWTSISEGAEGIYSAITGPFERAFNAVKGMIDTFWNGLPGWLKGALEMAGNVAGGVTSAVSGALQKIGDDINAAKAQVQIQVPQAQQQAAAPPGAVPTGSVPTGGGGAGGSAENEAAKAQRMAEQVMSAEKLVTAAQRQAELATAQTQAQELEIASKNKIFEIAEKYGELTAKSLSDEERSILLKAQGLEIENERLSLDQKLAELKSDAVQNVQEEIKLLEAKIAGKEKEYLLQKQINELVEASGGTLSEGEAGGLVNRAAQLREEASAVEALEQQYQSLASGIAGEVTGALSSIIDGTKSTEEAFADMLKGIAKKFMDMAMQILTDQLTQQLMGLFGGLMGGGGGAGGLMKFGPGFAEGGTPPLNEPVLVGERGPEIVTFDKPAQVHPNHESRSMLDRYGPNDSPAAGGMEGASRFEMQTTVINNVEYATMDQVQAMGRQATAEGAKKGEQLTLRKMRNSRSTRSQLGM